MDLVPLACASGLTRLWFADRQFIDDLFHSLRGLGQFRRPAVVGRRRSRFLVSGSRPAPPAAPEYQPCPTLCPSVSAYATRASGVVSLIAPQTASHPLASLPCGPPTMSLNLAAVMDAMRPRRSTS